MSDSESLPFSRVRYLGKDSILHQQLFATLGEVAPDLEQIHDVEPEAEDGATDKKACAPRILAPGRDALLLFDERGIAPKSAVEAQLAHLRQMFAAVVKVFAAPPNVPFSVDRKNCDAVLDAKLATNKAALSAVLLEVSLRKEERFESVEAEKKLYVQRHFADKYLALIPGWIEVLSTITPVGDNDAGDIHAISRGLETVQNLLMAIKERGFDGGLIHDLGNAFTTFSFVHFVKENLGGEDLIIFEALEAALDEFEAYRSAVVAARAGKTSWLAVASGGFNGSEKVTIEKLFESGEMEIFRGLGICLIDDNEEVLQSAKAVLTRADASAWSFNPRHSDLGPGELADFLEELSENPDLILLDNDLGTSPGGEAKFGHQFIESLQGKFPEALILCHSADALALNANKENLYTRSGIRIVNKMDFAAMAEALKSRKARGEEEGGVAETFESDL